jgi:GMP synthase (glutamine-hydrolysing)
MDTRPGTGLHIIQNDPEVPPGNIVEHLTIPYRIHYPYRGERLPALDQVQALIVLGGAMGANDEQKHPFLLGVKQLIRQVVAAGVPYLGVCLGGQLLAAALGGKVVSGRWQELGTLPVKLTAEGTADLLFRGIDEQFKTFQWHHDSFDVPAGGVLLATSAACPHQAFRVGVSAWGLQFHPEVTAQIIRDWCAWESTKAATTEELVAAFKAEAENYHATVRQLMNNFLLAAQLLPKSPR